MTSTNDESYPVYSNPPMGLDPGPNYRLPIVRPYLPPPQVPVNFPLDNRFYINTTEPNPFTIKPIATEWKTNEHYALRLFVDTDAVQFSNAPLRQIGGDNFDMVDDSYLIEPIGDGKVRLHLASTYRLTTRLNSIGVLWMDFFMQDLQNYILQIEKERSETQG